VETFYLSLFFEGRLSCFSPVTYLKPLDLTQIRQDLHPRKESRLCEKAALRWQKTLPRQLSHQRQYIKDF
jgi:hypothetical protein